MDSSPFSNKFKSRKEWEDYVWDKLMNGLARADSLNEIKEALDLLITDHEKKKIINRASAISLLREGKSYRDIGGMLWLSPVTVSAIKKSLREKTRYKSSYARNKKPEKKIKPLTKKELEQLRFSAWVESLFILPSPPIRHPRLQRQLGYNRRFSKKHNRYFYTPY